jgi:hypothetical protein
MNPTGGGGAHKFLGPRGVKYLNTALGALLSEHPSHISALTVPILYCSSIASYYPYIRVSIRLGYYTGKLIFYYLSGLLMNCKLC